jgi:hypothetical protein
MPELNHRAPDLDARLSDIDRRLREIQADLKRTGNVPPSGPVDVVAGPFGGVDDVKGFEQALSGLPGVAEVTVRGYDGADRAIFEVRLA